MIITRTWAMPNANTFECPPIGAFVHKYLAQSKVSVDPFSRNSNLATYTNDLNPDTSAQYHMEAGEFLKYLSEQGIMADLLIFDPPYSPRQVKECYNGIGRKMQKEDALGGFCRKQWNNAGLGILYLGAVVLNFGWNTVGMGKGNMFEIEEILLVCHGSDHNDTICMAERKIAEQGELGI
jgi:hypothetical protein